jgi:transcriptional regulator with XRE-family HTH domain
MMQETGGAFQVMGHFVRESDIDNLEIRTYIERASQHTGGDSMRPDKLGALLRDLRTARGLTQQELARRLGIARSAIAQIENGKRKLSAAELLQLAGVFDMPVEQLVDPARRPQVDLEHEETLREQPPAIRVSVPQSRVRKLKEILLHILSRIGARPHVGETILYKLLYFADFDFYERYEEQLIGARYIKNRYGPTPMEFRGVVQQMEKAGDIEVVKSEYFAYPQTKYLPRREPDLAQLTAREIAMVDEVLDRLGHMNATQVSEYSHKDVPWVVTEEGKLIEYETVFYRTPDYSVRENADSEGDEGDCG